VSTSSRSDAPPDPITDALAERIAARLLPQIVDALAAQLQKRPTLRLATTEQAIESFGVSEPMLRRWRDAGMPVVWCGTSPRYEIDACLAWLRAQTKAGADAA
jgi:hypothetical protein